MSIRDYKLNLLFIQLAYAIQKESPFYWLFHYHITKMKESGTLNEIQNKYSSQGQICPDKSGEALDMNQCFSAFIIIVAGLALALIFLGYVASILKFDL